MTERTVRTAARAAQEVVVVKRVRTLRTQDSDARTYSVSVACDDGGRCAGTLTLIWRLRDIANPVVKWCGVLDEVFEARPDLRDAVADKLAAAS